MKQNEDAAPSILDGVWRDAMRYRFVRVADGVRISHEAARDPVVYDEAIDRAILERQCAGLPVPKEDEPGELPARLQALLDVLAERRRQIEAEGWTPEHDDKHAEGLACAAACYAVGDRRLMIAGDMADIEVWPWDESWWKPTNRRRDLVKAAALILAEIERLDRVAAKPEASRG